MLDGAGAVTQAAASMVSWIKAFSADDARVLQPITALFIYCRQEDHPELKQLKQSTCGDLGAVDALLDVYYAASVHSHQAQALRTLGQMCFRNSHCCSLVGRHPTAIDALCNEICGSNFELMRQASYVVTLICSNAWQTHSRILPLGPRFLQILVSDAFPLELRANSVRFFSHLSFNPECHNQLIACGCVAPLVTAMNTNSLQWRCTTAAIAVANLLCPPDRRHEIPHLFSNKELMQHMVEALSATLDGDAYPRGSGTYYTDWKLAFGIANMSLFEDARRLLLEMNLMTQINKGLRATGTHTELRQQLLEILWNLMELDSSISRVS